MVKMCFHIESIRGSTHYLDDRIEFNFSNEGPSSGSDRVSRYYENFGVFYPLPFLTFFNDPFWNIIVSNWC